MLQPFPHYSVIVSSLYRMAPKLLLFVSFGGPGGQSGMPMTSCDGDSKADGNFSSFSSLERSKGTMKEKPLAKDVTGEQVSEQRLSRALL